MDYKRGRRLLKSEMSKWHELARPVVISAMFASCFVIAFAMPVPPEATILKLLPYFIVFLLMVFAGLLALDKLEARSSQKTNR